MVANLSELRAQPAAVLAEGDVTIGPYRRLGTATAPGLVLALVLLGSVVLLAANGMIPPQPGPFFMIGAILFLMFYRFRPLWITTSLPDFWRGDLL